MRLQLTNFICSEIVKKWLEDYYFHCVENGLYADEYSKKVEELSKLIDEDLARKIGRLSFVETFIPAYHIAKLLGKDIKSTTEAISVVEKYFGLKDLMNYIKSIHISNEWDRMAQFSMIRNYTLASITVVIRLLKEFNGDIEKLIESRKGYYDNYITDLNTIMGIKSINLHPAMLLYDKLQKIFK